METASRHQNFYAKISGLGGTTGWSAAEVKPYVEFVLDKFGTDRCCCGGDWPVSLLTGNYTHTWQSYIDVVNDLSAVADRDKVFFSNAQQFYKLKK